MTWVQLNDRLVPADEARVSVFDRGFMYGDGVFETMRAYRGHTFQLEAHYRRFEASASAIRLPFPYRLDRISNDIQAVLERNDLTGTDAAVRVSISRGRGVRGPGIAGATDPTYVVAADPLPETVAERRSLGIRLATVRTRRISGEALPAHAKHANYLNSILACAEANEAGADDALLLDSFGKIGECSGANIFLVNGARVLTPDLKTGILPGCARAFVLELCGSNGLDADEVRLDPSVLDDVEEVFVTNSVLEIAPVCGVDYREYRVTGPVTSMLQELYRQGVEVEDRWV